MTVRRGERVADVIRAVLARALREEVRDPLLGFVTLTGVRLAPDLRSARVYISVLGGEAERTLEALRRAAPFLRRTLARRAGLRFTPALRFVFDPTLESGSRIDELLRRTHDEQEGKEEESADAPDGSGATE